MLVATNSATLRTNLVNETKAFASFATTPIGSTYVLYKESGRAKISQQIEEFTSLDERIKNITIVNDKGKPVFTQNKDAETAIPVNEAIRYEPTYVTNAQNNNLERVTYPYISTSGLHQYSIVYSVSSSHIDQTIQETVRSLILLSLGGMLFSAFLIFIFVNRVLLTPLRYLSQEALAISDGLFDRQISLKRRDEIADLGGAINHMAHTLQDDIRKLRETDKVKSEFLSIASHHLRTPLTTIEGYASLLQNAKDISPEKTADYLAEITRSTDRLRFLTNDMLTIASLEVGEQENALELNYIGPLITSTVSQFKPLADKKGIELHFEPQMSQDKVYYSATQLHSVFEKILENSLEYTASGGIIDFTVASDSANIVIKIADTGSGIDASELSLLFTKFHRGTDLMQYEHDGVGLGLYLAKLIIDQHHGSIDVTSEKDVGTTVTITLPLAHTQPSDSIATIQ
jgi:signal transduction histidine kinase